MVTLWLATALFGQHPDPAGPNADSSQNVRAVLVTETIHLDGHLDEGAWAAADSIDGFRQREPRSGEPATERTVVRVLRDAAALYVGIRAYDGEPGAIRASQLRRDADLDVDDEVSFLIDSFRDRRGAFLFKTNPNGAMWDAQLTGFENVNEDWNGIWDVAATRDPLGWTAEFRVPFRTLRFRAGTSAFGFNVGRRIRRKNEETLWRSYGRTEGFILLLNAGEITGLDDVAAGRGLEVKPYGLARAVTNDHDIFGATLGGSEISAKAGLDAKVAVSPTLTADLTVNTDFAQVEADRQVINLTRFPFFFPEKREFFLESSGLFNFGNQQRASLFYTRRIGLIAGNPVPILGGARLTGKAGPWAIGVLGARTGGEDDANDVVVRVKHDLFERSYLGGMATARWGPGVTGTERAAGLDVDLPLRVKGQNLEPSFWIAGTQTPGVPGTPLAWRYGTDFPNDLFDNFVSLYRVQAGFAPTLGFTRRTGIWETTGHVNFMPRPHLLGIRQLDIQFPIPDWDIIADETGSLFRSSDWQTAEFEFRPLGGTFQSGASFELNILRQLDAPRDTFEIFPGTRLPPGRYWWTLVQLQYSMSPGRPLSLGGELSTGSLYDGTSTELALRGNWRGSGHLILGADLSWARIRLPAGRFTALQTTGRLEYNFNPRTSFLAFVQFNNEDQRADFNLRFHWIPTIGDDLYVVWNSGYTTDPLAPHRFPAPRILGTPLNSALVVKASHRLAL